MEESVSELERLILMGRMEEAAAESKKLLVLHGGHGLSGSRDILLVRLLYALLQSFFLCGR